MSPYETCLVDSAGHVLQVSSFPSESSINLLTPLRQNPPTLKGEPGGDIQFGLSPHSLATGHCICSYLLPEEASLMMIRQGRISLGILHDIFRPVLLGSTLGLCAIKSRVHCLPSSVGHGLSLVEWPQIKPNIGWPLPQVLHHHCFRTFYRLDKLQIKGSVIGLVSKFLLWEPADPDQRD